MAHYGNFNLNRRRRGNKLLIAVVCVIVFLLAALFFIGITTNSGSEDMQRISAAVAENTELKQEISDLNAEIIRLQEEINNLNMQLEVRPTVPPAPAVTIPPASRYSAAEEDEAVSPRDGLR